MSTKDDKFLAKQEQQAKQEARGSGKTMHDGDAAALKAMRDVLRGGN